MKKIVCKVFVLSFLMISITFLMANSYSKNTYAYDYIDDDGYEVTVTDFDIKPSDESDDNSEYEFITIIEQPVINTDVPKEQIKNNDELETVLSKSEAKYIKEYNFYMEHKSESSSMELEDFIEARKSGLSFSQAIKKCEVIDYSKFYDEMFDQFQENEEEIKKNISDYLGFITSEAGQDVFNRIGEFFQNILEDIGVI